MNSASFRLRILTGVAATAPFACLALACAALTCAGCLGTGKVPMHRYYRLPIADKVTPSGPRLPVVLRVEEFEVMPAYDHLRLVYRISPYEMRHYGFRQWVTKPGRLVGDALREYLRFSGRFKKVTDLPRPLAQYSFSGKVEAIEEVDKGKKGRIWYSHLALTMRLRRSSDGKIIWERRMDQYERVSRRRPKNIVAGLTIILRRAAARALSEITDAIRTDLKAGR